VVWQMQSALFQPRERSGRGVLLCWPRGAGGCRVVAWASRLALSLLLGGGGGGENLNVRTDLRRAWDPFCHCKATGNRRLASG